MDEGQSNVNEFLYKIVIVGNTNVGKTNILSQYTEQTFIENQKNTIGVDFKIYETQYRNKSLIV